MKSPCIGICSLLTLRKKADMEYQSYICGKNHWLLEPDLSQFEQVLAGLAEA
jgi:hypothetical protein